MKNIFFFFFLFIHSINAQVGINTHDPKSTLDVVARNSTENLAEGIIAPRLSKELLIAKDAFYTSEQQGAFVYVDSLLVDSTSSKTANILQTGYYYFDGLIWQAFSSFKQTLYLPSFNLPLEKISKNNLYNLYTDVYKKQFTKQGNPNFVSSNSNMEQIPVIYNSQDLDFVITYYDPTVITVNNISSEGILNYDILNTNPDNESFINIVLVVK